jgi:hypothetical protein
LQAEPWADAAGLPESWLRDSDVSAARHLHRTAAAAGGLTGPHHDDNTSHIAATLPLEEQPQHGEGQPGRNDVLIGLPDSRGLKPTRREKNIVAQRLWRVKQKVHICAVGHEFPADMA